jgi:Tfp pilus assembly protein FimV
VSEEQSQDGYEQELVEYEKKLASYLQERIKPNLNRTAIPLVARAIAKEITRREPPESPEGGGAQAQAEQPDFEAEMHELQAELGEDWILRFSVQGDDAWLTAENQAEGHRVEAPDAQGLVPIVEAINQGGGRRR